MSKDDGSRQGTEFLYIRPNRMDLGTVWILVYKLHLLTLLKTADKSHHTICRHPRRRRSRDNRRFCHCEDVAGEKWWRYNSTSRAKSVTNIYRNRSKRRRNKRHRRRYHDLSLQRCVDDSLWKIGPSADPNGRPLKADQPPMPP